MCNDSNSTSFGATNGCFKKLRNLGFNGTFFGQFFIFRCKLLTLLSHAHRKHGNFVILRFSPKIKSIAFTSTQTFHLCI